MSKYFKKGIGHYKETSSGKEEILPLEKFPQVAAAGDLVERQHEGKKEVRKILEKIEHENGSIVLVLTSEVGEYNGA